MAVLEDFQIISNLPLDKLQNQRIVQLVSSSYLPFHPLLGVLSMSLSPSPIFSFSTYEPDYAERMQLIGEYARINLRALETSSFPLALAPTVEHSFQHAVYKTLQSTSRKGLTN